MIFLKSNQFGNLQDLKNLVLRYYTLKGEYLSHAFSPEGFRNKRFEKEHIEQSPFISIVMKYGCQGLSMQIPANEMKLAHKNLDKMEDELRGMNGRKEIKWQRH